MAFNQQNAYNPYLTGEDSIPTNNGPTASSAKESAQPRLPGVETMPDDTDWEQTTEARENGKENVNSMLKSIYNRLFDGKAGAWTAAFTCVLAVFSYLLWQVSRDANNTSTATQAASVSSFGPGIVKVPNADGKTLKGYNIFFNWANSGTTPTKSTVMQANVSMGSSSPSKGFDFSTLQQSSSVTAVLGPKAGIQVPPNFVSIEDVQQGKKHMFFWGWVVYHDIFSDTPRLSEYCSTSKVPVGPNRITPTRLVI